MTEPEQGERQAAVRRILVALDASRESLAALTTAAQVARRFQAELVGLFVEDSDLFKLAQHSFVREINLHTRAGRALDPDVIAHELKLQAALARRALEEAAGQFRLRWSFRVTRGKVEAELISAALEADLVAVGKAIRPLTGAMRLGRTAQALTSGCARSVLFAVPENRLGESVALAYDGSPTAADALDLAARIADADGGRLTVFLVAESSDVGAEYESAVRRRLRGRHLDLSFRRVYGRGCRDILQVIEAERPRLLVVGVAPGSAANEPLRPVLECSTCPVLLVRKQEAQAA